jgi:DNA-binding protein HU-beta
MNKRELISAISEKTGQTKAATEACLNATLDAITEAMLAGESVQLIGFGTFEVRSRGERNARNPKDGSTLVIPASKVPAIKFGKGLKDKIAGK